MQKLIDIDFRLVGNWVQIDSNNKPVFDLKTEWKQETGLVYAFVLNGELLYIGKTRQVFNTLLNNYRNVTNGTRQRIREKKLLSLLMDGHIIDIYAHSPDVSIVYKGFKVSILEGLETALIAHFSPEWNNHGKD